MYLLLGCDLKVNSQKHFPICSDVCDVVMWEKVPLRKSKNVPNDYENVLENSDFVNNI